MKPKNTTKSRVPEELNAVIQEAGIQSDLDGSSRFARQIELIGLAGNAFELSNELAEVQHALPSLESRALERAWDAWCDALGKPEWTEMGSLKWVPGRRGSSPGTEVPAHLHIAWSLSTRSAPKIRMLIHPHRTGHDAVSLRLPQQLNWADMGAVHALLGALGDTPDWAVLLLGLWRAQLKAIEPEQSALHARLETARGLRSSGVDRWVALTWQLLERREWTSVQGDEVHQDADLDELIAGSLGQMASPLLEWRGPNKKPWIILAFRLVRPSASNKRWLIEGVRVSDDLFSSPQGQASFACWKRTADLLHALRLHGEGHLGSSLL